MFSQKNQSKSETSHPDERFSDAGLDRLGLELLSATRPAEDEVRAAVSTPFLYARIRARIAAEQERRATAESTGLWRAMLQTAWRPIAGMSAMAVLAAIVSLFAATGLPGGVDEDVLAAGEPGFESVVFTDTEPLSNDEVLATIMNQDETDVPR